MGLNPFHSVSKHLFSRPTQVFSLLLIAFKNKLKNKIHAFCETIRVRRKFYEKKHRVGYQFHGTCIREEKKKILI